MSNYLANLVNRGAGIGPWMAIGPPAAKPDFISGDSVGHRTEHHLAPRSGDSERLLSGRPPATLPRKPVPPALEERWQPRQSDPAAATLPSPETRTIPVASFPGEKTLPSFADDGVPGDRQSSVALYPRQPDAPDDRRHRDDAAEILSSESDPLPGKIRQLDRHPPEMRTAHSAWPASERGQGFPVKQQALPGIPADSETGGAAQSGDAIHPLAIRREDRFPQRVDPIGSPSRASPVKIPESRTSALNGEKENRRVPQKIQSEATYQGSKVTAAPSESHRQLIAAAKAASAAIPGNGANRHEYPAPEPPVQVRIGRVEVRADPTPPKAPTQPVPPAPKGGFGEYYAMRNYEFPEY